VPLLQTDRLSRIPVTSSSSQRATPPATRLIVQTPPGSINPGVVVRVIPGVFSARLQILGSPGTLIDPILYTESPTWNSSSLLRLVC